MRVTEKRLSIPVAAVLLAATLGLLVILGSQSAVANPGAPNPGHGWAEVEDHGIDGGTGNYWLGPTVNEELELRVNGNSALRLEPNATSPNVIGGYESNQVYDSAVGATIGGGGSAEHHRVYDDYGTVGGGSKNIAGDWDGNAALQTHATVGGGYWNAAIASYATVGGGDRNWANDKWGTVAGGRENQAGNGSTTVGNEEMYATVGGGWNNDAFAYRATIGGGMNNTASGEACTVGGGGGNTASASASFCTVSGGQANTVTDTHGTIGGGRSNEVGAAYATVAGGRENVANDAYATVGGGYDNEAAAEYATIAGGGRSTLGDLATRNQVTDDYGSIGGGGNNTAGVDDANTTNQTYATVSGGMSNTASGEYATIGGGHENDASLTSATVGGGYLNEAIDWNATVCGGWDNTASAGSATVGGGEKNVANGLRATVGGGGDNAANGSDSTVGGGRYNLVAAVADYGTIAGGGPSVPGTPIATRNWVSDEYGTIGGGGYNTAGNSSTTLGNEEPYTTISGGKHNRTLNQYSTVGGGSDNTASGDYATVSGGLGNSAENPSATVGGGNGNHAYAQTSTVGGGSGNIANAQSATVPGGASNSAAGDWSFAAGNRAKVSAAHDGTFLWSDAQPWDFDSAAINEFAVRATGGARVVTAIDGSGVPTAGVELTAGDNAWGPLTLPSARDLKEDFTAVDGQEVLATVAELPITTWSYKTQDDSVRHMGAVAQDFYAAFGLGEDDRHISYIDGDGVALAAIQGLYELSQEQAQRIDALESDNASLNERLDGLEERVTALEGGAPLERGSESLTSSMMPAGWLILAGLFVFGGLVAVQRRFAGGPR